MTWDELHLAVMGTVQGDVSDAVARQLLKQKLVQKERETEMEHLRDKNVWTKRPVETARQFIGKPPISVKLVDANKGDDLNPNCHSRFVARETGREGEDLIFAPIPLFESL